MHQTKCAFAPASIGNVAVGFDILGLAMAGVGDRVWVSRIEQPTVVISSIEGCVDSLPSSPEKNTASRALMVMRERYRLPFGFRVRIEKGIPLGSGMGGSAASAVAAVLAANALLDHPLSREQLLLLAVEGERVASGAAHADNVAPALFGGLVLIDSQHGVHPIPTPSSLRCVLVHPDQRLDTKDSRRVLQRDFPLSTIISQQRNLALFLVACFRDDVPLISASLSDVLIEPLRAPLIPFFEAVSQGAQRAGALGCSISGGGPSVFAWCKSEDAEPIKEAMLRGFVDHGVLAQGYISPLNSPGAHIVEAK